MLESLSMFLILIQYFSAIVFTLAAVLKLTGQPKSIFQKQKEQFFDKYGIDRKGTWFLVLNAALFQSFMIHSNKNIAGIFLIGLAELWGAVSLFTQFPVPNRPAGDLSDFAVLARLALLIVTAGAIVFHVCTILLFI